MNMTIVSHYKDPFMNLFQYFHQFMSLVGFVATSHMAHQLYMKTAPMIDLNALNVYLHYIVHIFGKNPGWTPPHSPGSQ